MRRSAEQVIEGTLCRVDCARKRSKGSESFEFEISIRQRSMHWIKRVRMLENFQAF